MIKHFCDNCAKEVQGKAQDRMEDYPAVAAKRKIRCDIRFVYVGNGGGFDGTAVLCGTCAKDYLRRTMEKLDG